jgi:TonB family protein
MNSCVVRVLVTKPTSTIGIDAARAVAVDKKTGKSYRSVLKEDMPYFVALPEGDYRMTVSRSGFKTSVYELFNDCRDADGSTFAWSAEMEKGSPKEIVRKQVSTYTAAAVPNITPIGVRTIVGGVLNDRATSFPLPEWPAVKGLTDLERRVIVNVTVSETGNVISAIAASGHPKLRPAAEMAARNAKFKPLIISGSAVRVQGTVNYSYVPKV